MRLLVLGGTRFVGRAIVEEALEFGHKVTIFNRGQSNSNLFPDVERVVGDRDGGLGALSGRTWDAVVDTCGYVPRLVRDSAEILKDCVDHYTFISSISVFSRFDMPGLDERSPLATLSDESTEEVNDETYGPLKRLCEKELEAALPGRSLLVRPGLIVGPHDESDRLTYWVWRVSQGGEVLAPGHSDSPMQFIDVRDLAHWTLQATDERLTGPFICTGPDQPLTTGKLLETCRQVSGSDATFTWVGDHFLERQGIVDDSEKPWWVPEEFVGYSTFKIAHALQGGLLFRPLELTVKDTLRWHATRPANHAWNSGLNPAREKELLNLWHRSYSASADRNIAVESR